MDEWIQRKLLLKINLYDLPLLKSRPYHLIQVLVNTVRLLKTVGNDDLETDFLYAPWIDILVYPFPKGLFNNNLVSFYQRNEQREGSQRLFDTERRIKKEIIKKGSREAFCEKRENLSEVHKKVLEKARLSIVHQRNEQEQSPPQPHFGTQVWLKRGSLKRFPKDLHEEVRSQVEIDKKDRTKLISFQLKEKVKILESILKRFKEVDSEDSYKKEVKYSIDFGSIFSPSTKFSPPKEKGQNIRFTEILIKKLSEKIKEISKFQDDINMRTNISAKLNLTKDGYVGKPIYNMDYGRSSLLSLEKKEIVEDHKLLAKSPLQIISHQFSKRIQGVSASMELLSKAIKMDTANGSSTLLYSKEDSFYQKAKPTDISGQLSLTSNSNPSPLNELSLLNSLIEGYWKNRGRKNITLGTQLLQYKEKSSIFTPSVQNTFNIKILGGTLRREEDLSDLADKISRILKEQARRHGIDLT